ncbi:MAG: complex I NDUFA9 subunit family protein [Rhodobacteraceae bacterium]|nr:complex I NDUFA9 subunit family protein [Paracoccaceae bacterium]
MAGIATVFGGSGFIGRYITWRLAREGWRVRVAVRNPNEAGFVRTYGAPGQVEPVLANIRFDQSVRDAVVSSDAVINCVGILAESSRQKFTGLHRRGADSIARHAAAHGVTRLVQLSAIGADPDSPSAYARTKAEGERVVLDAFPSATILRPSVVFGNEDQFLNKFAAMARMAPVIPLVGANTLFQPVYADDVARAAVRAVSSDTLGGIYELGGPDILSFRDIITSMLHCIRRRRMTLDLPFWMARIMATKLDILQLLSGHVFINTILTRDQVTMLQSDTIVAPDAAGFAELGIEPKAMDGIIEGYLYRFRPAGQYTAIHESAQSLNTMNGDS